MSAYAISKTAINRFSEILALETARDNITVFAVDPGTVRTAMTDYALTPDVRKWDDLIPRIFAEGHDVPPDRAAQLTVVLASGKADALSGRLIGVHDDLDEMISQAQRIKDEKLYVFQLHRL